MDVWSTSLKLCLQLIIYRFAKMQFFNISKIKLLLFFIRFNFFPANFSQPSFDRLAPNFARMLQPFYNLARDYNRRGQFWKVPKPGHGIINIEQSVNFVAPAVTLSLAVMKRLNIFKPNKKVTIKIVMPFRKCHCDSSELSSFHKMH